MLNESNLHQQRPPSTSILLMLNWDFTSSHFNLTIDHHISTSIASIRALSTMTSTSARSSLSIMASLSMLERLPAEIQHMIFGLLGFLVGTYMLIDCPGPPTCTNNSHVIIHKDAKWPMKWHASPGHFHIRKKIEQIAIRTRSEGPAGLYIRIKYQTGEGVVSKIIPGLKKY